MFQIRFKYVELCILIIKSQNSETTKHILRLFRAIQFTQLTTINIVVLHIPLLNLLPVNNVQYLGKIEQTHYKTLFLCSSKACDEVRAFAITNNKSTNDTKLQHNNADRTSHSGQLMYYFHQT